MRCPQFQAGLRVSRLARFFRAGGLRAPARAGHLDTEAMNEFNVYLCSNTGSVQSRQILLSRCLSV